MRIKRLISLIIPLILLSSCSRGHIDYGENVSNKYLDIIPNVLVEKNDEVTFEDITANQYISMMKEGKSFICLFHTEGCPACKSAKEHYLVPYMEETKNKIYCLDVYQEENYEKMNEIKELQPSSTSYIKYNDNNVLVVSRPLLQIVQEGNVISYELGLTKNLLYMLEGYVVK